MNVQNILSKTSSATRTSRVRASESIPSGGQLTGIYDATAWYWDSIFHQIFYGRAYVKLFQRLRDEGWVNHADRRERVLDCGIGTGMFSGALVRAVKKRLEVYGVDVSGRMMARARSRLAELGVAPRLEFADIRQLPFGAEQMDFVISALTLEHLSEPGQAIQEMTRVARSGASIVIVTTRAFLPDVLFRSAYRYRPFRRSQLERWVRHAGLVDLRRYSLTGITRAFGYACVARKP